MCGNRVCYRAAGSATPQLSRSREHRVTAATGGNPWPSPVSNVTAARNPVKNGGTSTTPRTTTPQLSRSREHRVTAATGGNPWPSPVSVQPQLMSRGNLESTTYTVYDIMLQWGRGS